MMMMMMIIIINFLVVVTCKLTHQTLTIKHPEAIISKEQNGNLITSSFDEKKDKESLHHCQKGVRRRITSNYSPADNRVLHGVSYLFGTAGRMASNLNLETAFSGTCPRQLAHRRVQTATLQRFLVPTLEGATRGSHRRGRFFHRTTLLLGTIGFTIGGIATKVVEY
jgi:hypothetical protein